MPPKAGLDRASVVRAAASLVNAEGVGALSLTRLARDLGVRTPSLFNHIDGLPGLRRELALLNAKALADRLGMVAIGRSGPDALRELAIAFRAYILSNPGVYLSSLRVSGSGQSPDPELQAAESRLVEICLAVLASFDLQGEEALHALRGLRSLVHGFATLEIAGGFGLPLDCDESFRRLVELFLRGIQERRSEC